MWFPGLWKLVVFVSNWLHKRGRDEAAVDLLRAYVRRRPRDPKGWLTLSGAMGRHGASWAESEHILREGLTVNPEDEELTYWLAISLTQQHKYKEAETVLESFRAALPASPLPYLGLARLSSFRREPRQKKTALALESYGRIFAAEEIQPVHKRWLATFFLLEPEHISRRLSNYWGTQPEPGMLGHISSSESYSRIEGLGRPAGTFGWQLDGGRIARTT